VGVAAPGLGLQIGVVLTQWMTHRIEPGIGVPRLERVGDVGQAGGGELGEVPQDDGLETAVVDPLLTLVGVDLRSMFIAI
jgi:hypothetical protein